MIKLIWKKPKEVGGGLRDVKTQGEKLKKKFKTRTMFWENYKFFSFISSIYFSLSFIVPLLGTTTRKDRVKS